MSYNTVFMKTFPTKVKTLDCQFIYRRIFELLNIEDIQQHFYENIYTCFFSQIGFPFENVYTKSDNKNYSDLKYGDVIILDEIVNYSKLYQHVSKDISVFEYIFIEQYLDRNPDPNIADVWKNKIPINLEYKIMNKTSMPIYNYSDLKNKDENLFNEFTQFIHKHKSDYIQYIFLHFKSIYPEKYETITLQCDDISKLNEMIWEEYFNRYLA